VELPPGITGVCVWAGQEHKLEGGTNQIDFAP
jgi:hypothetical protein